MSAAVSGSTSDSRLSPAPRPRTEAVRGSPEAASALALELATDPACVNAARPLGLAGEHGLGWAASATGRDDVDAGPSLIQLRPAGARAGRNAGTPRGCGRR